MIVVAVDPPYVHRALCGIVVVEKDTQFDRIYVKADLSLEADRPAHWAIVAARAEHDLGAACVLAPQDDRVRGVLKECGCKGVVGVITARPFPERFARLMGMYARQRLINTAQMPALAEEIVRCEEKPYGQPRDRVDALLMAIDYLDRSAQPRVIF